MDDLPTDAHVAIGLVPGENLVEAWRATHRRGTTTGNLPNFPEGMTGFLVLTSRRIVFVQEAGNRAARTYQAIPPLTWSLSSITQPIPAPTSGRDAWIIVQGEYFSVGRGGAQENGRAQWSLERGRKSTQAPAAAPARYSPPKPIASFAPPTAPPVPRTPSPAPSPAPVTVPPAVESAPVPPPSPSPAQAPAVRPAAEPPAQAVQGLSRPGSPTWPMVPVTLVETADTNAFWSIVGSSGVERGKLLVFCTESPGELSASYGLAGATLWRISSNEGEGRVRPGDVDHLGDLISGHFDQGSGQAVVMKGLDRVIEDAGFRSARKLLEVAREAAERTRGAVIVHADPVNIGPKELHQLEDDAKVLKV